MLGYSKTYLEYITRPKEKTPLNWTTYIYSAGKELKYYGCFPNRFELPLTVQHGVYLSDFGLDKYETINDDTYYYCFSSRIKKIHDQESRKKSLVGPPPFLIHKNRKKIKQAEDAIGTIYFVSHSSLTATYEYDIDLLIDWIINCDNRFKPVCVMLHWVDVYKYKKHLKFFERNISVYSCGYAYDEKFAERFYEIASKFKYAGGNEPTSGLFYSQELGLKSFIFGPKARFSELSTDHRATDIPFSEFTTYKKCIMLFTIDSFDDLERDRSELKLFVDGELGLKHHISRALFIYHIYKLKFRLIFKELKSINLRFVLRKSYRDFRKKVSMSLRSRYMFRKK